MAAKQTYFAELAVLTPYDEKVISEMTMYGLPMWKVGGIVRAGARRRRCRAGAAPPPCAGPRPTPWSRTRLVLSVGGPGTAVRPGRPGPERHRERHLLRRGRQRPGRPVPAGAAVRRPRRQSSRSSCPRRGRSLDAESQDLSRLRAVLRAAGDRRGRQRAVDRPRRRRRLPGHAGTGGQPRRRRRLHVQLPGGGGRTVPAQRRGRRHRRAAPLHPHRHRGDLRRRVGDGLRRPRPSCAARHPSWSSTVGFSRPDRPHDTQRVYVLYKVADGGAGNWDGVDLVRTGTDPVDGSAIWTGGAVLPACRPEDRVPRPGRSTRSATSPTRSTRPATSWPPRPRTARWTPRSHPRTP